MLNKDFEQQLNNQYGSGNKKRLAQKMLQGTVEAGMAVVNILYATGIAGFRFHVPESEMVKFENDVTDHFIESNTAVQDHIAQKPITITLTGFTGDYFYSNHKIMDMVSAITSTVTVVREFLPDISEKVQELKNQKMRTEGIDKLSPNDYAGIYADDLNALDIFALMQGMYKFVSAQTRAFLFFEALWKARKLFTVETSWRRYDNMVIQSIQATRDNNADVTEFSVTFKQLSFTQTLVESTQEYANRMEQQRAKVTNKGLLEGRYLTIESEFA